VASPVAVLGDASSSMSVAVRTSTIIASLLATICSAKLTFFHSGNFEAKLRDPKNVSDVLEIAYFDEGIGLFITCRLSSALLQPMRGH